MPVGLNTLQCQPQSHRRFLGVQRARTLLGQPNHGPSANPSSSGGRSPGVPPGTQPSRCQGAELERRVSSPPQPTLLGALPFSVPLGLLAFQKGGGTLQPALVSHLTHTASLAHSNVGLTQPVGGHLRGKTQNLKTVTGRCPTSGLHPTSPAPSHYRPADTTFTASLRRILGQATGSRLGLVLPPGDIWPSLETFSFVTTGSRGGLL